MRPLGTRIVVASHNAGKLAEFSDLLGPFGLEAKSAKDFGLPEPEETGTTFEENAYIKAFAAAQATGLPALSDDSGLAVDALGGQPGVASAHFADVVLPVGEREVQRRVQDEANNALLLQRLQGRPDRRAKFVSTLVAIRSADDPEPLVAVGRWQGEILAAPRGAGGFGYDPLMFIPALGKSVADLDAATKNAHSHRALAAAQMLALMHESWHLG